MLRLCLQIFFCLTLLISSSHSMAQSPYSEEKVPLIIDMPPEDEAFYGKRFRTTRDNPVGGAINLKGFHSLNIMGSGAFTEGQLQRASDLAEGPLFLIDLRKESHGFLNGHPISWYAQRNWANLYLTPEEVDADEAQRLGSITIGAGTLIPEVLSKTRDGTISQVKQHCMQVNEVLSEAELASRNGIIYVRLYISDHMSPTDEQVDFFMDIVRALPEDASLYFHCRGGVGRTTTFMVMYDIIKNAKRVTLKDIFTRQLAIGGKDLLDYGSEESYKYEEAVERLEFAKNFYYYIRGGNDTAGVKWSTWHSQLLKESPLQTER